jgi:mersacidin/lichenicidin family type 2 lantibiotic
MKNNVDVIRAWKDAAYRATLTEEQLKSLPENPVNDSNALLDNIALRNISGGRPSAGWFCSVSGECNGGYSCNPYYW